MVSELKHLSSEQRAKQRRAREYWRGTTARHDEASPWRRRRRRVRRPLRRAGGRTGHYPRIEGPPRCDRQCTSRETEGRETGQRRTSWSTGVRRGMRFGVCRGGRGVTAYLLYNGPPSASEGQCLRGDTRGVGKPPRRVASSVRARCACMAQCPRRRPEGARVFLDQVRDRTGVCGKRLG